MNPVGKVREVYADLANRPVERQCIARTQCCQFRLTGLTPELTKGEALLAAKAFRATGRKQLPVRADGACPLLHTETGRCLIYADRPFGCRTHFCEAAGGMIPRKDVVDLIRRLEQIDQELGGDGPHQIVPALTAALRQAER
ncbi:MAG: YkgJ family cysteine cluster protein [Verrucomicrobiota bacterium]